MTGLTRNLTKIYSVIDYSLASIEITVVNRLVSGTVGFGTLIFAFGIGPAVALGLSIVKKI